MSSATFLILSVAVIAAAVLGLALVVSWLIRDVRDLAECYRGIPTEVVCPRTEQWTKVRIGTRHGQPGLHVLSCERFPEGGPRCAFECFRVFTGARHNAA